MLQITQLPPPLMTSEPGSFAYNTFKVRVPLIIDDIVRSNGFPEDIAQSMQALRREIINGTISPLSEDAADVEFWNESAKPWLGRSWLQLPWYWAEAYFYRRVLQATRYFQPGAWKGVDPYRAQKLSELHPTAAPRVVSQVLESIATTDQRLGFDIMLHSSLWGNRTDLSYNVANTIGPTQAIHSERANILVDHTSRVWDFIQAHGSLSIHVITDNAGTELLMDLALSDFLLSNALASSITLHLKPQPFFVSDAMAADVMDSIHALRNLPAPLAGLGHRLSQYLDDVRLVLDTHWFYPTGLFYFQMPDDLIDRLREANLVILKGDANYRRLLGDAHWQPEYPFDDATAYFPTPFVALRTLKAEIIVGLEDGLAQQLNAQDADWRVNGRRGVIQSNLSKH